MESLATGENKAGKTRGESIWSGKLKRKREKKVDEEKMHGG